MIHFSPSPPLVWRWSGRETHDTQTGTFRVIGNVARLTVPRQLTVTTSTGKRIPVQLPERFSFIVYAWAVSGSVDRKLPVEDWAPNSGWFRYPT